MFGFPISKVDKDKINSNYLQTVTFQINFPEIKDFGAKQTEIKELIKKVIPDCDGDKKPHKNIDFNQDGSMKISSTEVLEFFSQDKGLVVLINPTFLSFIIQGYQYKNFTDSKKYISVLEKLLVILNINSTTRTAIRKVNILNSIENNIQESMQNFFNAKLLPDLNSLPTTNQAIILSQTYHKPPFQVVINYGKVINQSNQHKDEIILDIDLFCVENRRNETLKTFKEINDEVFNIFCWALSEESLLKISQSEKKNV